MKLSIDFEKWRFIKNCYGRYKISNFGRVMSCVKDKEGILLSQSFSGKGYLKVNLMINGKRVTRRVHRLVAEAFIPNPKGLPQINHMDRVKTNNHVSNLQWSTNWANSIHYQDTENLKTKYPRGVSYQKRNKVNKYIATIMENGKSVCLGSFIDVESAAEAYRKAASLRS